MSHADVAQIAAVVGGIGCACLLLVRGRGGYFLGLAAIVAAEALLGWSLVPSEDLRLIVASPVRIGAVAIACLALAAAGVVLARYPFVVPVVALAAAPFRLRVELGDQEAFLLIPLYAVIAAAAIGLAVRAVRGEDVPALPRVLSWPAAAFVGYAASSLLWSEDVRAGTIDLLFFLFPFVVLAAVLARAPYAGALPRRLATTQVVLALLFAGVGIWQLWSEDLFFARDLEVANAYTDYFRTTSLFADSSIYGLQLVLGIVVLLVALWLGGLNLLAGAALIAALWTGLYFTYSQSSMISLAVAALAVSLVAATRRARRALAVGTAVVVLGGAGLVAAVVHGDSTQRFTGGRSGLIEGTWKVVRDHPAFGVGVGSQPRASRDAGGKRDTARNASHTTPLTVTAEGGVVGLALYVAFLLAAARLLDSAYRLRPVLGLGLAGAFVAVFVHSLLYAGFFQNPITWGVLGVAAAVLAVAPHPGVQPFQASTSPPVTPTPVPGRWQT